MKNYMAFFGIVALFLAGTQQSTAQKQNQTQQTKDAAYYAKQRELGVAQAATKDEGATVEALARQQTAQLSELVNLDSKQTVMVQEMLVIIEKKRSRLMTVTDEKKKAAELKILENAKEEKLKGILTPAQFSRYLDAARHVKQ